jgi:hypothetical protein
MGRNQREEENDAAATRPAVTLKEFGQRRQYRHGRVEWI